MSDIETINNLFNSLRLHIIRDTRNFYDYKTTNEDTASTSSRYIIRNDKNISDK